MAPTLHMLQHHPTRHPDPLGGLNEMLLWGHQDCSLLRLVHITYKLAQLFFSLFFVFVGRISTCVWPIWAVCELYPFLLQVLDVVDVLLASADELEHALERLMADCEAEIKISSLQSKATVPDQIFGRLLCASTPSRAV